MYTSLFRRLIVSYVTRPTRYTLFLPPSNQRPHPCAGKLQVRSRGLDAPGLVLEVGLTGTILAGLAAAERAGAGNLDGLGVGAGGGLLEGGEQLLGGLGGQVLVVVVVDLDHGGVDAGAQALHLDEGEEPVRRRLPLLDPQLLLHRAYDLVAAAASELARCLFVRAAIAGTVSLLLSLKGRGGCIMDVRETGSQSEVGKTLTVVQTWT